MSKFTNCNEFAEPQTKQRGNQRNQQKTQHKERNLTDFNDLPE